MILVTGGAGFIGSNFVLDWLAEHDEPVVNLDKLTYAGNLRSLAGLVGDARHVFVRGDIGDAEMVNALLSRHRPRAIVNLAAETHVDRSIRGPRAFVDTNIVGTFTLLECTRTWWETLPPDERAAFRFLHVSTDEVYGSLGPIDPAFSETTAFAPNSPYAASKAASDHMVRAWHHTYGLPTLTTNCSNNYGPRQFPEKLIPLMIVNALAGKPLPGLWRREERSRLALCRRSLQLDPRGARARTPRRDLQRRRQRGDDQPRCRPYAVQAAGGAHSRSRLCGAGRRSSPIAPATTGATRSTRRRSAPGLAGPLRRASSRGWREPSTGISPTVNGWRACRATSTASGWISSMRERTTAMRRSGKAWR